MTRQLGRFCAGAVALVIAAVLMAVSASTGQQPPPMPEIKELPKKEYDPTVPGPGLKDVLIQPKDMKTAQPKASGVRLRGRVISKTGAIVSLEIDGFSYILPVGGEAQSVKVLQISTTGVEIEVGPRKEIRVLH